MDTVTAPTAKFKDRNKRLRKKIEALQQDLILANLRIQELEKDNFLLRTFSSDLREQLSSLTIKLELQEQSQMPSPRFSSFPFSDDSLLTAAQKKRSGLSSSQSMAGSTDSSPPIGSHTEAIRQEEVSSAAPSSGSLSTRSNNKKADSSAHLKAYGPLEVLKESIEGEEDLSRAAAFRAPYAGPKSSTEPSLMIRETSETASFSIQAELILEQLRSGAKVEEELLVELASLFFDGNATVLDYLASQSPSVIPAELMQSSSSNGIPLRTILPQNGDAQPLIVFLEPFDSSSVSQLHSSPFPRFSEQASKLRLMNTTQENLHLTVYTFASPGCFLGFTLSRSILRPRDESRLMFSLVSTSFSPPVALGFAVLAVQAVSEQSRSSSSKSSESSAIPIQYICFGSTVHLTPPSQSEQVWKINLSRLSENLADVLLSTPTSMVYPTMLLGAELTSRIFKRDPSLGDLKAFQEFTSLVSSIQHPNVASIVGISDKRPFRIICQQWSCTLTTSLGATYAALLQKQSRAGEFQKNFNSPSLLPLHLISRHGRENLLVTHSRRKTFPLLESLQHRLLIAQDILAALSALHSKNKLHRDLTTDCIGMVTPTYALLVEMMSASAPDVSSRVVPTHRWIPPEIEDGTGKYSIQSDIFAFGVILLDLVMCAPVSMALGVLDRCSLNSVLAMWNESLLNHTPNGITLKHETKQGATLRDGETFPSLLLQLSNLIYRCCHSNPECRPKISTIEYEISNAISELSDTAMPASVSAQSNHIRAAGRQRG